MPSKVRERLNHSRTGLAYNVKSVGAWKLILLALIVLDLLIAGYAIYALANGDPGWLTTSAPPSRRA